jgi:alpha-methylacyl-CoA racemase
MRTTDTRREAERLPLGGVRVLTLAVNLPGPVAACRLCGMGAAVVKVEPPGGDPLARMCPGYYAELSAGQEVVSMDLKAREDRVSLDNYLENMDLLLTASRPAALGRLGLSWPELRARFPRLCQVAIVGHPPLMRMRQATISPTRLASGRFRHPRCLPSWWPTWRVPRGP